MAILFTLNVLVPSHTGFGCSALTLPSNLAILTSPERAVGIKVVCEEAIALALADDQNTFRHQHSLELAIWLDLTLTRPPRLGGRILDKARNVFIA